jgi:hypothetical protein
MPHLYSTGNLAGSAIKICPEFHYFPSPPLFSCQSKPPLSPTWVTFYDTPCSHPCPHASQSRVILSKLISGHVTPLIRTRPWLPISLGVKASIFRIWLHGPPELTFINPGSPHLVTIDSVLFFQQALPWKLPSSFLSTQRWPSCTFLNY